ncbi:unnamed protein product [Tetraodon nigroviridis]|uniref:(spotted green pufferfish) hypothetical protein n=1 Tax=Tetraodon nigroviridis TaxID=99883 RepID=Q4RIA6_TETNG|nr:unnamed protein product [Tetraodon nigroviridis]
MNTSSSGRKTPVDYGVQIRFINDLCDASGAQPGPQPKARPQTTSKYGVAVRVQGIAGQPYVVLKDGQKGDSYGVQLKTNYPSGYSSLPRRREKVTPDLLLDQGPSAEMSSEEEQVMQTIYNILRQGCRSPQSRFSLFKLDYFYKPSVSVFIRTNESDVITRHKVKVIFQKIQNLKPKERVPEEWLREKRELERKLRELQIATEEEKRDCASNSDPALKAELEACLDENLQLREMLDRKKTELNETQSE